MSDDKTTPMTKHLLSNLVAVEVILRTRTFDPPALAREIVDVLDDLQRAELKEIE